MPIFNRYMSKMNGSDYLINKLFSSNWTMYRFCLFLTELFLLNSEIQNLETTAVFTHFAVLPNNYLDICTVSEAYTYLILFAVLN